MSELSSGLQLQGPHAGKLFMALVYEMSCVLWPCNKFYMCMFLLMRAVSLMSHLLIDGLMVKGLQRYGVSPENIILYGQSIGTVPTVDLASRYECAAVILHSPLMSGLRVAFPDTRKTYCFDAFPSIDKISKVTSPVLVIHGTEDEVIDFSHGLAMYERCPRAVEPLWVEGAGHNDIELYAQYLERLKQFISHELPNS
ncbi:PREDICTED: alpha/beta hydrolase domain-containing protein 17C-like [Apaloderma vittatum]|uniref:alpha/beta hydrolase domain-containing protein 17C-like n=1 Tax=Apaloderma vittatum TaxID=57397 RepID=UPI00052180A7|nr:PREDICTED: alpha/beta hydrolase domain-containing protein 17C-like [Apaloderma vittatum]